LTISQSDDDGDEDTKDVSDEIDYVSSITYSFFPFGIGA